jgi:hypothetical protein
MAAALGVVVGETAAAAGAGAAAAAAAMCGAGWRVVVSSSRVVEVVVHQGPSTWVVRRQRWGTQGRMRAMRVVLLVVVVMAEACGVQATRLATMGRVGKMKTCRWVDYWEIRMLLYPDLPLPPVHTLIAQTVTTHTCELCCASLAL